MPDSTTPNYGWAYPTVNADDNTWGTTLNTALLAIDNDLKSVSDVAAGKQAANALLTSLSALAGDSGKIIYFSGASAFGELSIGSKLAINAGVLNISGLTTGDVSGLGTSATQNHTVSTVGPSGGNDGDTWDVVAA